MSSSVVDDKGRIIIPENIRKKVGIRNASKVKVSLKGDGVMVTSTIDAKQFIEGMEGFIKKRTRTKLNPLKVKQIWTTGKNK